MGSSIRLPVPREQIRFIYSGQTVVNNRITFRPITSQDEDFLYRVYAGTREEELAPLNWSDSQKHAFLRMQFGFQHRYYTEQFIDAEFMVIQRDGHPIGRLYLHRRKDEIRIVDIALLPEYRGAGVGTHLIENIMAEAETQRLPVRLYVEKFNRALRLYQRLGFTVIQDAGINLLMQWSPRFANTKEFAATPGQTD